ncbi:MAG: response regulator [Deltaproteobacteria bacterium]|nr:response regulator [Deltaproteobacteria bacterium]
MLKYIKRILVVDEEAELKHSIIRHLRRNGFVMDSAFGDEDAKRKIITSRKIRLPFDLVIRIFLEQHPGGIEFIDWIHRHHASVSIIIISGLGNMNWITDMLNPEKDAFTQNPLTPGKIMSTISHIEERLHNARNS